MRLGILVLSILVSSGCLSGAQAQTPDIQGKTQPAPLFDTYFFSSDGQKYSRGSVQISAIAGSTVEDRGDSFKIYSGEIYISTGGNGTSIDTGAATFAVSPDSVAYIKHNDQYLSSGKSNATITKSDSQPLLIVGHSDNLLATAQSDTVSLAQGSIFFAPDRDIKIQTPMGLLNAKANSLFFVTASEHSLRVQFCKGKTMTYNFGSKYRRINPSQEFAVFDHRPFEWEVLPPDGLGRKQVTLHDLNKDNHTACSCTFSLITLLRSPSYLGGWGRKSGTDKKLVGGMIKTAAVYAAANPSYDNFYQAQTLVDKKLNTGGSRF